MLSHCKGKNSWLQGDTANLGLGINGNDRGKKDQVKPNKNVLRQPNVAALVSHVEEGQEEVDKAGGIPGRDVERG